MLTLKTIAVMHSDFHSKFGVPRQSNLVKQLSARIVFQPEYRNPDALRGLERFSHIWLIWGFSETVQQGWHPMVRPPRLGGNTRMGVFATRSPFRPNPVGLSSVEISSIENHPSLGPVIHVLGADLMDKTPIYDIKPYLPFVDSHPDAGCGFADTPPEASLLVEDPGNRLDCLPLEKRHAVREVLAQDPRPSYQQDPQRLYGMAFGGFDIRFTVDGKVLTVVEVAPEKDNMPRK